MYTLVVYTYSLNGVLIGQTNNFHRRWMFQLQVSTLCVCVCVCVCELRGFVLLQNAVVGSNHIEIGFEVHINAYILCA